ncbi:MAG: hypothetical protein EBR82_32525 [Caulobacteraceae bacterium]|nr:hypothetical protein [Caulobacteraceae bacterium]
MDVRLPDGTVVTNVPDGITQSELMRRLGKGTPPSQEWMARTMANMTLADKNPLERAAIQLGAGADTFMTGLKQLFQSDKPEKLSDLVSNDTPLKRSQREGGQMRLLKKALADASDTNTLPDWVPTAGAALQTTGEAMPLMAVPVGGYVRGATALPRALGWMRAGAGPARLGTGALAADAAMGGAVSGALNPTAEGESRATNAAFGAAAGAAAPIAMAGLGQGLNMVTRGGGNRRAGAQIADELTEGAADSNAVLRQTIDRLRAQGGQQGAIPLSAAAQLRDPQLARLEAGSRARNGANWYDFDQNQARAVADEVSAATRGAQDVDVRRGLRSNNRQVLFNQAMGSINEPAFARDLVGFRNNLDLATRTPEASNPAVRNMLTQLADEIDRLGDDFRPEHLATIRANLASKAPLVPTNAYQAAPRESPATMSVLREVDNILNNATGGRWSPVLQAYKRDSDIVRSSQAAGKVRDAFWNPETGLVRDKVNSADAAGEVPLITRFALGSVMDKTRGPQGPMLDSTAETRLRSVLDALRAQGIVQGVKRSATAGGGSNTASDQFAAKAAGKVGDAVAGMAGGPAGAVTKGMLSAALDWANTHRDRALAEALQDPQRLIQILEGRIRAGQPLSTAEEGVLQILRAA